LLFPRVCTSAVSLIHNGTRECPWGEQRTIGVRRLFLSGQMSEGTEESEDGLVTLLPVRTSGAGGGCFAW